VLAVYVVGCPLATLLWVRHRIRTLVDQGKHGLPDGANAAKPDARTWQQRVDEHAAVLRHPTLAPFTAGDYRASAFWFRHVDLAALAWLSIVLVFWARPNSSAACIGKALATSVCALTVLLLLWRFLPYPSHARWKLHVRSVGLVVAMLAAAANCTASIDGRGVASLALGALLTTSCMVMLVTLVVAFGYSSITGAHREVAQQAAARERRNASLPDAAARHAAVQGTPQETRVQQPAAAAAMQPRPTASARRSTAGRDDAGPGEHDNDVTNPLWSRAGPTAAASTRHLQAAHERLARESRIGFVPRVATQSSPSARQRKDDAATAGVVLGALVKSSALGPSRTVGHTV
jgi:hypothetical protein